ncbi:deoxyribonuclease IV [Blastopirellula sp. JC732]|uniref:Probable endonuclease 4 n=1 Tax=Blastopirellula sediminis TaxID=2894196 RepID=A0A9X1MLI4_9BACT|nr:deoxyribonuclease IV [Blastopirellula sediminis]MCC9608763.1 deoxyribonuclease IV [Blastopirellula sediminis]MCC9628460.1 deoxyribonuclease IV [Blastopirellula sediminis]
MPIFGAHMSIAGGYYKAVNAAAEESMGCVQLFTKNNNQWRAKDITDKEVKLFKDALAEKKVGYPLSHASYLINMGSPKTELWEKSRDAMIVELQRADQLGIPYVVVHPGAYVDSSEEEGIAAVIKALDEVIAATADLDSICLLETTAGQGSCLGHKFEHIAAMLDGVKKKDRVAVCLDTCHIFAAGYPLGTKKEYEETWKQFEDLIGVDKLKAIHLNDSKKPLGSRVDRHEHIGQGCLGEEPFRLLLNDARFKQMPMYLETPKGEEEGETYDSRNIATLRRLLKS